MDDKIFELLTAIEKSLPTLRTITALEARIKDLEKTINRASKRRADKSNSMRKGEIDVTKVMETIIYAKSFQSDKAYADALRIGYMPRSKLQKLLRVSAERFNTLINECVASGKIEKIVFVRGEHFKYTDFHGIMYRARYFPESIVKDAEYVKLISWLTAPRDNYDELKQDGLFTQEMRLKIGEHLRLYNS